MKQPLDTRPIRKDLTDRECCAALGGLLGGLIRLADLESLRNAVRWWAETDEAWKVLEETKATLEQHGF